MQWCSFVLSKQYNSVTPAEPIGGTLGCLLAEQSEFSSSIFLPVGGLSWSSNISSSRGNGKQPPRPLRLRSHWIINIHSPQRGKRGGLPIRLHIPALGLSPSQSQQWESNCSRTRMLHTQIRRMHGWPFYIPKNRQREACKSPPRRHFMVISVGGAAPICTHGSTRLHFLWHYRRPFKLQEQETASMVFLCVFT